MPVSVVVGGQYGSEGKGKTALELARSDPDITAVVRPGGTNSGHTGYDTSGQRFVLRQLPAASIRRDIVTCIPAGAYVDPELLLAEVKLLGLPPNSVKIDPRAHVIRSDHVAWEVNSGLSHSIGSTASGTGAAVLARIARYAEGFPVGMEARDDHRLHAFLADTEEDLHKRLQKGERVLIEGTQGFGLSPVHGDTWPKATSRDTTAAALLAECALPIGQVDQIIVVLRCFPIRVAGDSGPLVNETTWSNIARTSGSAEALVEFTSVTKKIRRVGEFDPTLARRAIRVNGATHVVLNHLDYVDCAVFGRDRLTAKANQFVEGVERELGLAIDSVGTGPTSQISLAGAGVRRRSSLVDARA